MPQVPNFDPSSSIPFYYPCNFPLIQEVLRRDGSVCSLGLLANSRLYGLPACSSSGLMKWYFNKLDYAESVWRIDGYGEMGSFEEGMNRIRERIGGNRLFIATGTSYYLPYCDDYLNPKYIEKLTEPDSQLYLVDHWLAVYGADEDRLLVYDPVPARYKGPLSLDAFRDFWAGNQSIPELAGAKRKEELRVFGFVDVSAEAKLTPQGYKDALLRTLATHTHEYLNATELREGDRTYYFGHAVTLLLLKRLHLGPEAQSPDGQLSSFLFNMRWSRYFFLDLLKEIDAAFGPGFASWSGEFGAIVKGWEQAHKLLAGEAGREASAELNRFVRQIADREYRFYEAVWSEAKDAGLFPKRPKAETEDAARRREELAGIVLDGCREMNRHYNSRIPVELGPQAPLYGRYGNLDSLALVTLLAVVEQDIQDKLGVEIELSESDAPARPDHPFRTVETFVGYIMERLPRTG